MILQAKEVEESMVSLLKGLLRPVVRRVSAWVEDSPSVTVLPAPTQVQKVVPAAVCGARRPLSEPTRALLESLQDGDWHDVAEVLDAVGRALPVEECLVEGERVTKVRARKQPLTVEQVEVSGRKSKAFSNVMIAVRSGLIERDGQRRRLAERGAEALRSGVIPPRAVTIVG